MHFDVFTEMLYKEIADTRADYLMLHVANLRNIESLLKLKPPDKTIVFWDFDDAMYVCGSQEFFRPPLGSLRPPDRV